MEGAIADLAQNISLGTAALSEPSGTVPPAADRAEGAPQDPPETFPKAGKPKAAKKAG